MKINKSVLLNQKNIQRSQQLFKQFQQKPYTLSPLFFSFLSSIDRNTLRKGLFFEKFRLIFDSLLPQLITNPIINRYSFNLSKVTAVYAHLNLHRHSWFQHLDYQFSLLLQKNKKIDLEDLVNVYKPIVELNDFNHPKLLAETRERIIHEILATHEPLLKNPSFLENNQLILRTLMSLHKHVYTLLLDPTLDPTELQILIQLIERLFCHLKITVQLSSHFDYGHIAKAYDYMQVFKVRIRIEEYHQFLEKVYHQYRKIHLKEKKKFQLQEGRDDDNGDFNSRRFQSMGESVFEMRFQKHLRNNGYWFQRNKVIGLNQFDILLKGTRLTPNRPFEHLDPNIISSNVRPPAISSTYLKQCQQMPNLRYFKRFKHFQDEIVLNLNGPFHYIDSDVNGQHLIIRSEAIKYKLLEYHGYSYYNIVDWRDWEKQTTNAEGITRYFKNLIDTAKVTRDSPINEMRKDIGKSLD